MGSTMMGRRSGRCGLGKGGQGKGGRGIQWKVSLNGGREKRASELSDQADIAGESSSR
jgi:hypothetical protein